MPGPDARAGASPSSPAPVLEVRDLSVSFSLETGTLSAVRGLGYAVAPGEVLGIVGESGCGKTVAALAVMGLLPRGASVTGSVRFQGREVLGLGDRELSTLRGRGMSMVFQDPLAALTPVYTVGDQVAEAVRAHRQVGRGEAARRAVELLDLVGIPRAVERAGSFPHELSGGMRQRVLIAMAIANDPDVIIADEPTTALDVTVQAQVLDVLATARKATGAALVLITHDLGVIAGMADRVLVMYAGRAVEVAPAEELFERPRMPYTMGLLGSLPRLDAPRHQPLTPVEGRPPSLVDLPPGCPFSPRCPLRVEVCREQEPDLEPVGGGHVAACHRSSDVDSAGLTAADIFGTPTFAGLPLDEHRDRRPTVLEVRDLVRHFPLRRGTFLRRRVGTVHAVDGVRFDIREGETLGLVGESGCGKTTTVNEILSLTAPAGGSVAVLGQDTSALDRAGRKAVRRSVGAVFQDPTGSLDPRMPVADILAEGPKAHGIPAAERDERVRRVLRLVGLEPDHARRYPHELSGGQRQRVALARALALEPRLVVLDEPVSSLDVSVRAGIINLLEQLRAELGLAYLLVSHDLSVVRHVSDRLAVMYLGRIVELGQAEAVLEAPAHPYTRALLSAVPVPDPRRERGRRRILLQGELPSPVDPPGGCRFRTRCPLFATLDEERRQRCIAEDPSLQAGGADHEAACHYAGAAGGG